MAWYNNKNPGEPITSEDWNGLINSHLELNQAFTQWLLNNQFPNQELVNLQQIVNEFITKPIMSELTLTGPIKSNLVLDLGYITTSNTNPLRLGSNGTYPFEIHQNKLVVKVPIEVSEFQETTNSDWILTYYSNTIRKLSFASLLNRINQSLMTLTEGYRIDVVPTQTGFKIEHEINRPNDLIINPTNDQYVFVNYVRIDKAGHIDGIETRSIEPIINQINQNITNVANTFNTFVSDEYTPTINAINDELLNLDNIKLNKTTYNTFITNEYNPTKTSLQNQINDLNTTKLNKSMFDTFVDEEYTPTKTSLLNQINNLNMIKLNKSMFDEFVSGEYNKFITNEYTPTKQDLYEKISELNNIKLDKSTFNTFKNEDYNPFKQNTISTLELQGIALDELNTNKLSKSEFNQWKLNTIGQPSGIATLDASGKIPLNQLPDISKQPTYVLRSTDPRPTGVVAGTKLFETDTGDSYIYDGTNWVLFADADWANVNLDWNNIINKPTEYNPAPHNHDTRYYTKSEIDSFDFVQRGESLSNNYLLKTSNSRAVNSIIFDNGTNVGIGTSSPSAKLHVVGSIALTGGTRFIGTIDDNNLNFITSNTPRMTITNSGNIGIGTTTPSTALQVVGNIGLSGGSRFIGTIDSNNLSIRTNNQNRITITSAGNLGIGSDSPEAFFSVYKDSAGNLAENNAGILLKSGTGNNQMSLRFFVDNTNKYSAIQSTETGAAHRNLLLNPEGGFLGIGTTSPSYRVDVSGTLRTTQDTYLATSSGNVGIGTTSPSTKLQVAGDIGLSGGTRFIGTVDNNALNIRTNNQNRITISSDGNVGIGTTSPEARLHVIGHTYIESTYRSVKNFGLFGLNAYYSTPRYVRIYVQDVPSTSTLGSTYIRAFINGHDRGQGRALAEVFISGRDFYVDGRVTGPLENKDIIVYHNTQTNKYEVYLVNQGWSWPWSVDIETNVLGAWIDTSGTILESLPLGTTLWSLRQSAQRIYNNAGGEAILVNTNSNTQFNGRVAINTHRYPAMLNVNVPWTDNVGLRIGIDSYFDNNRPRVDIGVDGWVGYIKLYDSGDAIATHITAIGSYFSPPVSIGGEGSGYALYVSGTAYSTGGWQSSDITYKKNISELGEALKVIEQLRPVSFEWKKEEYPEKHFPDGKRFGLIAQEVEKVLPEVINTDEKTGEKALNYVELIPWLIKAVQELKEENEKLKKEIEALKVR